MLQVIVYGTTRLDRDPRTHRRLRLRRWYGWAKDATASDGAFMVTGPHIRRATAQGKVRREARAWSPAARRATPNETPPSGYGLEQGERGAT